MAACVHLIERSYAGESRSRNRGVALVQRIGAANTVRIGRYGMQGTPTSLVIGRNGRIAHHGFGQQGDMALGAIIAAELAKEI